MFLENNRSSHSEGQYWHGWTTKEALANQDTTKGRKDKAREPSAQVLGGQPSPVRGTCIYNREKAKTSRGNYKYLDLVFLYSWMKEDTK